MISVVLGPTLGLSPNVILLFSIGEGIAFTVIISLLAERYLFPMRRDRVPMMTTLIASCGFGSATITAGDVAQTLG
jgi:hypothetical protein